MQEIDIQELLSETWNKFVQRWKPLCVASLLGYFLPMAVFFAVYFFLFMGAIKAAHNGSSVDISSWLPIVIAYIVFIVAVTMFTYGAQNYCIKICRGENPEPKDFLLPVSTYLRIIAAMFLVMLAAAVGIGLCVIPGLILMFFFSFVSYAIIDHPELGIFDCMKHSLELVKPNWKPVLISFIIVYAIQSVLSSTVIGIIPAISFGILLQSLLYVKCNDKSANNAQPVIPPSYQP